MESNMSVTKAEMETSLICFRGKENPLNQPKLPLGTKNSEVKKEVNQNKGPEGKKRQLMAQPAECWEGPIAQTCSKLRKCRALWGLKMPLSSTEILPVIIPVHETQSQDREVRGGASDDAFMSTVD